MQTAVFRYAEHQRADAAGAAALALPPTADHDFLGVPDLVLDPRVRPTARLVGGVAFLRDHPFPAMLARVLHRLGAVTGQCVGDDEAAALRQRLEQAAAVREFGAKQRSTVEVQEVERPVLEAG